METKIIQVFKELGQFLGKKLDAVAESVRNTPQKIQVDMADTSKRIDELSVELSKQISALAESLSKSSDENYKGIQEATSSLSQFLISTTPDLSPSILNLKSSITSLVYSLSKDSTNNAKEIQKAVKETIKSFSSLEKSLNSLEIPNLKNTEKSLTKIYDCIESKMGEQATALKEGLSSMAEVIKKISIPDTFKLDEMQLRKLAGASKVSVDGGQMAARNVAITNLALAATNTEYSYTFPANTTAFTIKLRDQGTLAYYSFTTGTLPVIGGGGNGTKYATIPQNYLQSQEGVDWSGKIIYLGAESASQIAEITVFTM